MTSSSSSSPNLHLLLLPFLLSAAALLLSSISCKGDLIQIQCDDSPSDHPSDHFEKMLSDLLTSPPQTAGSTYVHSGTSYALAWCGGKLSGSGCSTCITKAAQTVRQRCRNRLVNARLLLPDFCFLRLDRKNFIWEDDGMRETMIDNSVGMVSGLHGDGFRVAVEGLMVGLMDEVLPRKQGIWGERVVVFGEDGSKIYGKGDCANGLDLETCRSCLYGMKSYLMGKCMFFKDCGVINGRCYLGFQNY